LLALAWVLSAAPAVFCAEQPKPPKKPSGKPPRRKPVEPAYIDESRPRITLKKEALRGTLSAIKDRSLSIEKRVNAIGLAGLARLKQAVPALCTVLKRQDVIDVKVAAVWGLREIGEPAAIPTLLLVQSQAAGPNPKLRYKKKISFPDTGVEMTFLELVEDAIGRLGALVTKKYLTILNTPAGSYRTEAQNTTNLQRAALAVIVCIGDRDPRAIKAMADILKAPPEAHPADFREMAALGLARVLVARTKEFAVVRARDKLADRITELLTGYIVRIKPSLHREFIASALNIARPIYAVTLLTRHFADNSSEEVRTRTVEVLGLLRTRESVEALVWVLEQEKSPELRWRAAFGLGLCGKSDMALKALAKALKDASPAVRRAAAGAVGRIGGKGRVKLVAPAVRDTDPRVRAAAARALGMSRDKAAVPHVLVAAKDKDVVVRATAVAALGALATRESLAAIVAAARDPERQVRYTAMKVLCNIHGPVACEALLGLVSDTDRRIRADASNALRIAAAHHPKSLKKALVKVITDPGNPASADACDFADFPNDPEIVKALKQAAGDRRPGVRASALRMLRRMGLR